MSPRRNNTRNNSERTFRQVAEEWLDFIRDKVARTTHDRYSDALIRDIVRTIMPNVMQFASDPDYGKAGMPRTIVSY